MADWTLVGRDVLKDGKRLLVLPAQEIPVRVCEAVLIETDWGIRVGVELESHITMGALLPEEDARLCRMMMDSGEWSDRGRRERSEGTDD